MATNVLSFLAKGLQANFLLSPTVVFWLYKIIPVDELMSENIPL